MTIELDAERAVADVTGGARPADRDASVDGISRGDARAIARALAPVRDTSTRRRRGDLPRAVALLDAARRCPSRRRTTSSRRWHGRPERALARADRRDRRRDLHGRPARATARTRSSAAPPARARASCCRRWSPSLARRAPARPADLPARRLQGRRGVQGLRRPAAHASAWSPTSTSTWPQRALIVARRRAQAPRAACCASAGAKDLIELERARPARRAAEPRHRRRRVRDAGQGGAGVRRRRRRRRPARPQPRRAPRARDAAPGRRRVATTSAPTPTCGSRCGSPAPAESEDVIGAPDAARICRARSRAARSRRAGQAS